MKKVAKTWKSASREVVKNGNQTLVEDIFGVAPTPPRSCEKTDAFPKRTEVVQPNPSVKNLKPASCEVPTRETANSICSTIGTVDARRETALHGGKWRSPLVITIGIVDPRRETAVHGGKLRRVRGRNQRVVKKWKPASREFHSKSRSRNCESH